jgi:hypothetical protein
MRVRPFLGARAPVEWRNFRACARGRATGRRFPRAPTARAHHAVEFQRLWMTVDMWTRLWSLSRLAALDPRLRCQATKGFPRSQAARARVSKDRTRGSTALRAYPLGATHSILRRFSRSNSDPAVSGSESSLAPRPVEDADGLLEFVLRHSGVDGRRLNIRVTQMLLERDADSPRSLDAAPRHTRPGPDAGGSSGDRSDGQGP